MGRAGIPFSFGLWKEFCKSHSTDAGVTSLSGVACLLYQMGIYRHCQFIIPQQSDTISRDGCEGRTGEDTVV